MTRRMLPISPRKNASGANTISVVAKEAMTPGATPRAPSMAAASGSLPRARSAAMFSAMTMASSTKMPTAIRRPTIVIMSIE